MTNFIRGVTVVAVTLAIGAVLSRVSAGEPQPYPQKPVSIQQQSPIKPLPPQVLPPGKPLPPQVLPPGKPQIQDQKPLPLPQPQGPVKKKK